MSTRCTTAASALLQRLAIACLLLLNFVPAAYAEATLAVLDFELNDLTLLPNTDQERERTASLRPMLEQALLQAGDVRVIEIDPAAVGEADAAFGYLFEHPEVVGRLGAAHGADWVLVGRLHKPSYLFVYLMARLVDSRTGTIAEDLLVEIKGQQQVVTQKGIERLAKKLAPRLRAGNNADSGTGKNTDSTTDKDLGVSAN